MRLGLNMISGSTEMEVETTTNQRERDSILKALGQIHTSISRIWSPLSTITASFGKQGELTSISMEFSKGALRKVSLPPELVATPLQSTLTTTVATEQAGAAKPL